MRGKVIFVFVMMASAAASASDRYAVTPGLVAATISKTGVQVAPEQVQMLAEVVASTPNPILKVSHVERPDNQRLLIRMECEKSSECLPFFVSLALVQQNNAQAAAPLASLLSAAFSASTAKSIVLRRGAHARLLLEGDHVHISIPVICLESGASGQAIRVTNNDRRIVYTAEIVSSALVKGRLQ